MHYYYKRFPCFFFRPCKIVSKFWSFRIFLITGLIKIRVTQTLKFISQVFEGWCIVLESLESLDRFFINPHSICKGSRRIFISLGKATSRFFSPGHRLSLRLFFVCNVKISFGYHAHTRKTTVLVVVYLRFFNGLSRTFRSPEICHSCSEYVIAFLYYTLP